MLWGTYREAHGELWGGYREAVGRVRGGLVREGRRMIKVLVGDYDFKSYVFVCLPEGGGGGGKALASPFSNSEVMHFPE